MRGIRSRLPSSVPLRGGGTPYGQPRSIIGGGEVSPQDPGAHLWVHTDEPNPAKQL